MPAHEHITHIAVRRSGSLCFFMNNRAITTNNMMINGTEAPAKVKKRLCGMNIIASEVLIKKPSVRPKPGTVTCRLKYFIIPCASPVTLEPVAATLSNENQITAKEAINTGLKQCGFPVYYPAVDKENNYYACQRQSKRAFKSRKCKS